MQTLEEQVQAYRDLGKQINELEAKRKELSLSIFQQLAEEKTIIAGYTVRRYERLSFRVPLEQAREYGATKTEEVIDKEALKKLYESGAEIPGVSPICYIQVSAPRKKEEPEPVATNPL
jgi:hypothetical protein